MRVAMLAPIAWRTPPRHYGPWERVTSLLTEELVRRGVDVTLFATKDSLTGGKLHAVCEAGYEEDPSVDAKAWECLHVSACFARAADFDIIHNQFDFLPLSYSPLVGTPVVTTIHGFSSPRILPVFKEYNGIGHYVSISDADRSPELTYERTIYHGIDIENFPFIGEPRGGYLLFFGRFHPDKGAAEAIEIAHRAGMRLVMAGIVQDRAYFDERIAPRIDGDKVRYAGSVGPEDRGRILGNAAALLHPIAFEEPFGLSVVEALACGTPVVAFSRGSMPELIRDGVTGFLVRSVEEAVKRLGDGLSRIDRNACRVDAERRFSKERMAGEYIELYRKIVNARRETA